MNLQSILKLDFLTGSRAYIAIVGFALACVGEWAGFDIPEFTAPPPLEAFFYVLGALGIYERAKITSETLAKLPPAKP